jgi:hypothetical protein
MLKKDSGAVMAAPEYNSFNDRIFQITTLSL